MTLADGSVRPSSSWLRSTVSVTAVSRMNLNRADLLGVYYPDYIAANWHTVLCSWAL